MLHQDELNFPHLSPPGRASLSTPPSSRQEASFVWKMKLNNTTPLTDKGKGKEKQVQPKGSETTPLTRQGYRTGRLAEDFWAALGAPNTPQLPRKRLKVIPFIIKSPANKELLIDKTHEPSLMLATIHIAEILAGIPWTTERVRKHVVNEISQALRKVLIYNSSSTNPFQQ